MKQVGNTILAKGGNHILAKRDNSAWPKGSKLSGFSNQNGTVMNKIVIEVTSDGWETTVTINGKEYKEKHVATAFGSESVEGNFEGEDDIPEEIYDALNSSFPFECMQALYAIED